MNQHLRNSMSLPPPRVRDLSDRPRTVGSIRAGSRRAVSSTELVAGVMLAGIAIAVAVMLLLTMPLAVGLPVAAAILVGPLWRGVAYVRRRRRRRSLRPALYALGAVSGTLLVLALAMPSEAGAVIAAIGLAGLLTIRVLAMIRGWAPRGSAWSRHRRAPLTASREGTRLAGAPRSLGAARATPPLPPPVPRSRTSRRAPCRVGSSSPGC